MSSTVVIRVRHAYPSSAERVFDAWITPSVASRFLFATSTGNVMQCELNPRVGFGFIVTDRRPAAEGDESVFDVVHRGTYVEIDRPRRLVFDFGVVSFSDETTRVTIDIAAQGTSACELTLSHELGDGDQARASEEQTRRGWTRMLRVLERELQVRRVGLS